MASRSRGIRSLIGESIGELRRKIGSKLDGWCSLSSRMPYSLENARKYWSYPPSSLYSKTNSEDYYQKDDAFIKNLIETDIRDRNERQDAATARSQVIHWMKKNNAQKMLDFGCGLGTEGVYFSISLGIKVVFADIAHPNVKLTSRYAKIWNIPTKSVYIDDSASFNFAEKFDIIFSNGVLHHIPEPKPVVNNLKLFLNPGGLFIVMLYTKEHYKAKGARNRAHYAARSEGPAPMATVNPYSDYYDIKKAKRLFSGCSLVDHWTSNKGTFGWYCFVCGSPPVR